MIKYGAGMGAYADSLGKSFGPTRDAIKGAQDLQDEGASFGGRSMASATIRSRPSTGRWSPA
jgi:hypothetical protein